MTCFHPNSHHQWIITTTATIRQKQCTASPHEERQLYEEMHPDAHGTHPMAAVIEPSRMRQRDCKHYTMARNHVWDVHVMGGRIMARVIWRHM
eukprot:856847-Prymnesium_polylepis.1